MFGQAVAQNRVLKPSLNPIQHYGSIRLYSGLNSTAETKGASGYANRGWRDRYTAPVELELRKTVFSGSP
jgi:hypothetical protein